ncbi:D-amino acid dehydrogenase small subunit [Candidatus Burkholderia verschuerenii]|uniref:D-amino acid dehydrogenase small subunit n=1 Tax=Candidatus Burkholderia verschuerenii TaxID=242163 RepID=A0A0L0M561_9BURK|nr:FAD-dependent oxidoreductase [Candidatus Burkholderia verschuerenii]KND57421.1 D-amino acid dehydrogenase small subunit [Candidatus Burkholderia verschuerenii]
MPSTSDSCDIAVIGAGVIGLALAHHLRKQGRSVRIIDRAEPASQCSMGNAGALSFHSVAPLAMPGVMKSAMSMLRDPDGPLYLPPAYLPYAAEWLWRFVRSAGETRVREIAASLSAFFRTAEADQRQLASEVGYAANLRTTGQLHLYRSDAHLAKDVLGWAIKTEHGLKLTRIGRDEIRAMEPDVSPDYPIGLFLENDHSVVNPHGYALAIARSIAQAGVTIRRADVTSIRPQADGWQIVTSDASLSARDVVIATGAWSTQLLAPLGVRVPLETQRGYHVHVPESATRLSRTIVLTDRKIFITPMDTGLRIAGTVEFGGLVREPNQRRAALLARHAKEGLPGLDLLGESSTWMGHRPCMPDSMPVLGSVPKYRGLWLAFGHGHLGLTSSATTGRLLAEAICMGSVASELEAFLVGRFGG